MLGPPFYFVETDSITSCGGALSLWQKCCVDAMNLMGQNDLFHHVFLTVLLA